MKVRYTALLTFFTVLFGGTLFAQPDVSIATNATLPQCPNMDITLTATASDGFDVINWIPAQLVTVVAGSNGAEVVLNAERSTTLIATAVYADTTVSDTFRVELFAAVIDIAQGDTALNCIDQQATMLQADLFAPPGTMVTWAPATGLNTTMGMSVLADPDEHTQYIATINTPDGCVTMDTVFVQVDSIYRTLDISAVPGPMPKCDKYCPGTDVALIATEADTSRYRNLVFQWTPESGIQEGDTLNSAGITTTVTTEYVLTIMNGACEVKDTILIEVVDPSIPLSVEDTTICPGMPVKVSFDPTDLSDIEWTAMPMDALQFMSCTDCPNPEIVIGNIGDVINQQFTFMVEAEKEECCPAMGSVTITVTTQSEPTVQVETCSGNPIQIEINPNLTNIQWEDPNGNLSCNDCFNPVVTINESTTFSYVALDQDDCTVIGSATVIVQPPMVILQDTVNYCPDEAVSLDISAFNLTNISWDANFGVTLGCGSCADQTATTDASDTYNVLFNATDVEGCPVSGTFTLMPYVNDVIEIDIADSTNTYAVGSTAVLELTIVPLPDNLVVTWCYNGEEIPGLTGTIVEVTVLSEGGNQYSAKFIDANGCPIEIATDLNGVLPIVQIPKAFTPNRDDENDFFFPVITNAEGTPAELITNFQIFSRWGELVYDNDDNTVGWDGEIDGEDAPSEVYIYLITLTYPDGNEQVFKGDVTLLR